MFVSRDSLLEAGDWEQGVVPRDIKFGEELNSRPVTRDSLSEAERKWASWEARERERQRERERERENCWPSFVCFI